MSLDFVNTDDIPIMFPSYPLHEFSGRSPQMPVYNVFHRPLSPQHPGAQPAAPMSSRNSTSQMPHASMAPLAPTARSKSSAKTNHPVRKRITRACDQCNLLRTKCDGQQPCTHCTGRKPRKERLVAILWSCCLAQELALESKRGTERERVARPLAWLTNSSLDEYRYRNGVPVQP